MLKNRKIALEKDAIILAASLIAAYFLNRTGVFAYLINGAAHFQFLGNFLAGTFFTSIFTAAPAGVILGNIAQTSGILQTALVGALGALVGDFLIFRLIEDTIAKDVALALKSSKYSHLKEIFGLRIFSWLAPFLGAVFIALPLPDELGLALMGLSKTRSVVFIPISFALHFLGISAVGIIAKQFI